ncbi:putative nuclear hormone receptor HR3, partial [Araneus ventricosus]
YTDNGDPEYIFYKWLHLHSPTISRSRQRTMLTAQHSTASKAAKLSRLRQQPAHKSGSFEMSVLRMSRYLDPITNLVMYGDTMIPSEAFTTADTSEMKLVNNTFETAKSIAELKLTESELALYSACVLLSPDRLGLKNISDVQTLYQAILKALKYELEQTHKLPYKGDVRVFDVLMAKLADLRDLSMLHMETLAKFRMSAPHLEFPALHKELFSIESA